jgi:hypothetical protein
MEGVNGRRVKFFLDDDDGVFGVDSTASTGVSPFVVRIATTERLRITSDGKIGVNNNNPSYTLDVNGDNGGGFTATTNSTAGQLSVVGKNSAGNVSAISRIKSHPSGSGNTSYMTFETRNSSSAMVERLRIDSDGYVTKPNQPSFHARRVNNASSTTNPLVFDSVHHNNGSHYKSSGTDQGKFVAPVSGVYLFYWTAIKTNNGSVCRLYINVDGSHIYSNMHLRLQEQGTYSNGSMQAIVNLNAGQKVHISLEAGDTHGNEYTHFGGYLIH